MSINHNRLVILLLAMLLACTSGFAATASKVSFSTSGNQVTLSNNTDYGFNLQFKLQDYSLETVQTKSGAFDQITIDGYGHTGRIGEPKLPVYSKLIAVPLGADVSYEILGRNQINLSQTSSRLEHQLIPAQLSVSKADDAAQAAFTVNREVYRLNEFVGGSMFSVEEIGIMRGVRVFRIDFEPIRYNPSSNELQISNDVSIKVNFNNPNMAATQDLLDRTGSVEYDAMYSKMFYNWQTNERVNNNRYPTKMLILCPPNYVTTMQPYVDWKKQQGYTVVLTTVGTGGTVANTTSAINTYMASVWAAATTANPAPTYLLIVGDTSTSGDNIIANTGASGSHVTDLTYVRLQGTDYLPEMYYGRFSVSSATELTNIINKTITFQKTAMPDLSYLGKVVMIAGADATYAPTYGNGQINYGTTLYFNSTNGLTSNTYLYPASATSDAAIIANANEGRGYMNYTAHGSETSWADPTFSVSDVNAMTNTNKYGVMVGNCCVTNAFGTSVCFGESIIRKANAGGVAYIGATNNSYWDEDYWWGIGYKTPIQAAAHPYSATTLGAYDSMFHTHSEAFTSWATTVGEINVLGNTAVEQSSSSRKPYYWEIYSIMGDPSTMPYLGVPTVNTATFPTTILIGTTSINITATPYSRVALSMGGVTYGTDLVPASGTLTLPITPFSTVGTAQLVITAQNKITRIESITIAPNSGAYMTVDANTYNDSNNSIPEYNETGRFTTTFKNVGSIASGTTTATLTCATAGITITDGTESIAALASGASIVKTNAFSFTVANNIVNQLSAAFTITMVSGSDTWTHNFNQLFNAPALSFNSITISDPTGNNNGRLDPGETVTVTMPLSNTGAATSPTGSATLTCSTSGITINTGTANYAAISASGSTNLSFSISASAGMSIGTVVSLNFSATAGAYTANKIETTTVGIILEDFETGNLNAFPWVTGGTLPWTVVNTGAYAGTYAAKSGNITHSQSSTMETTRILSTAGYVSFWYKVSSEASYDYLKFYIDGNIQNGSGWSGEIAWTQATYAVAAGTHVLKWEYMKDGSVDSGSNCAWIDNIIFPASTGPSVYNPPTNLAATASHAVVNLSWNAPASGTPTGYKIYKNSSLLTTVTALTYTDTAVTDGTTYSYYIIAAYSGGNSDATATVTATPNAVAPTNLAAVAGNALVALSWTASTGRAAEEVFGSSNERAISGYKVYRNSAAITTVTGTSYQDTGLTNGTTYSYYVTTVYANPAGESAASNTVNATPTNVVATEAILGSGTSVTGNTTAAPVNVYYKSLHGQSVYTAAELNAAGVFGPINITQLGFNITGLPTIAMPNFIVRMKHTTATDVASAWISVDASNVVYSNSSYLPTATGYNMYTLSNPFLWNGTDNLVIDTAFGVYTPNYASTGQVEYTTVTGGYRYGRSDTVDQTNLFSSTSTLTSRPNLKMVFAPVTSNPQIGVTPSTLNFGNVAVGASSVQSFTVTNTGGGTLTGTVTTPTGYNVAIQTRENRNTVAFSLTTGASRTYNLTFSPTSATAFNGNVVITSNSETQATYNLAVTGAGYTPPAIAVDADQLTASLVTGEESNETFTISNTGSQPLTYSIGLSEVRNRGTVLPLRIAKSDSGKSIDGSTCEVSVAEYTPGMTEDWVFSVYNASTDTEWLKDIYLSFPAGVTVNSVTNFVCTSGELIPDITSGTGITIDWNGVSGSWGIVHGAETAVATVNVTIPAGMSTPLSIGYQLDGDIYGAEPHTLSGNITLPASLPPVEWFSASPLSGTIPGGGNQTITGSFSAVGMEEGMYEALLSISSNDTLNPLKTVQILMEVAAGNHAPHINLPETCSFDKNDFLFMPFSTYISDADSDPLTLTVSGNTHIVANISGTNVTFSAPQNWIGSEMLTFTVSDGLLQASDNMLVTVDPTQMPNWEPVVYPNNPATLYAMVTIDGIPAQLNDVVAAFVGTECRGTGEIVLINRSIAYATLLVNLASSGETVSFKIYSHTADTVYPVVETMPMDTGAVYGETTPVPLDGTLNIVLSAPAISILSTPTGARLTWNAVQNANGYKVYACSEPYGTYTLLGSTASEQWDISPSANMMFYKVVAESTTPTKGSK